MSITPFPYLTVCLAAACLLLAAAGGLGFARSRRKFDLLVDALDYMSQGLCMFDATGRIVLCNRQYLRMYQLSSDVVKPGCTLRELIEQRKRTGLFTGDPEQYCKEIIDSIAIGKPSQWVVAASDGRTVHAINVPMPNGGWVSTHEDVTEQRILQQQRDDMAEQQKRRAVVDAAIATFRSGMEALLGTFGDSAAAMRATAVTLSAAANHGSLCATSAVEASNNASTGVRTAAGAADELSNSITEIARQITQTNGVVHLAVGEAQSTDGEMTSLAVLHRRSAISSSSFKPSPSRPIARAQCHDRSGARRRRGPWLRRRRLGGQIAGGTTAKATEAIGGQILAVQGSTTSAVGRSGASPSACTRSSIMCRASPPQSSSKAPRPTIFPRM